MQWSKLTFNPSQWRLSQGIRICGIDAINAQLYPVSMDIEGFCYDIYTGSFFYLQSTTQVCDYDNLKGVTTWSSQYCLSYNGIF